MKMLSLKSVKCHPLFASEQSINGEKLADMWIMGNSESAIPTHKIFITPLSDMISSLLAELPPFLETCLMVPDAPLSAIEHLIAFARSESLQLNEGDYVDLLELMQLLQFDYVNNCNVISDGDNNEELFAVSENVPQDDGVSSEQDIVAETESTDYSLNGDLEDVGLATKQKRTNVKPEPRDTIEFDEHLSGRIPRQKVVKREFHNCENGFVTEPGSGDVGSAVTDPSCSSSDLLFSCHHCDKCFSSDGHLRKHVRYKHRPTGLFRCGRCDFSTDHRNYLTTHCASVHDKRLDFKCELCLKQFSVKANLIRHVESVHYKTRCIACPHCPSTATNNSDLQKHIRRTHTNERPFCCATCGRAFTDHEKLRHHELSHSN